jgi:hypothetical protein
VPTRFSQIWPTPTRRAPAGATVSRELAGGLSHSLICDQTITEYELEKRKGANATGRPPVVFVHGLWLLPSAGTGGRRCLRKMAMRH